MKKWTSLLCVAALLMALLPGVTLPVTAAETSGKCGDNLTWEQKGGVLTISGTGPMYDYSATTFAPWYSLSDNISTIRLSEGITTISSYAFKNIKHCSLVVFPNSIAAIGNCIFDNTPFRIKTLIFLGDAPTFAENAFLGPASVNVNSIFEWSEEVKQNYGGKTEWGKAKIQIEYPEERQLVALNYEFQPEDFQFWVGYTYDKTYYIPKSVTFSEYDNSTCGEKNITITADGQTFDFIYYVTDGTNHLDLINVEFSDLPTYSGTSAADGIKPIVTIGTQKAKENTDYILRYIEKPKIGYGSITITGLGIWKDFSKTFYYPVLKENIGSHRYNTYDVYYTGMPVVPDTGIYLLDEGADFEYLYVNEINPGEATLRTVGLNNVYGYKESTFDILCGNQRVVLDGEPIGSYDGELSNEVPVYQQIVSPGKMNATINLGSNHVISYELYRLDGEDLTLILQTTKNNLNGTSTDLIYDFSKIYEGSMDTGGEVYVLSYSWVEGNNMLVYAGITYLLIPAKVPDATSMTMYKVEGDGDFRNEYFGVYGDDGALGDITWTSSNTAVASVENGIVVQHRPGTTTITAQWGDLTQSQTMTVDHLDLAQGVIFDYREAKGARVIWDNRILKEGTDYTLNVEKNGKAVTVTVTGCGLFTGELMKEFVNLDSLADRHTHSFDSSCDSTCNGCDFTRDRDHTFSTEWSKDLEIHYHECTACGEKADVSEHTLTGNGKECTVCGRLWTPGDIDGNGTVNRDDVIALLLHVSMPAAFPISIPADYNGDGLVTRDDVIQLLLHVSMPDAFPLQ